MSDRQQRVKALFNSVVELASPEERAEYLAKHCADDELRSEVLGLVAHDQELGRFMECSGEQVMTVAVPPVAEESLIGRQIGPYTIREQIGEGGMGYVYVAEQKKPLRRKVALKVIKPGMATKDVVARFEAERQALAIMDHPNIARVFDGGATSDGQPFFVMELVRGVPITEFCDQRKLTVRERLELFADVCFAVQHAHQKGVIHRDLKPSNVLVAELDGMPVPKVIDFGVAKAVDQKLTEQSVYTQFAQVIGTPIYMSPEQAALSGAYVDTRSDVYSLGVLLYELITGTTPFDRETLKKAPLDEIRRIIREEEPPRPIQRISTLSAEVLSTVVEARGTDVRRLKKETSKELDWIVVKTLEKDRSRRYDSASALAHDLKRYLNDEPVLACPPALIYRLRKFASRRKGALASAALIFFAMLAAMLTSIWYAGVAHDEAQRAKEAKKEADIARAETEDVFGFLVEDLLMDASPYQREQEKELTVLDAMRNAQRQVDEAFARRPTLRAAVRHTLGSVFYARKSYHEARENFFQAFQLRKQHLGETATATLNSHRTYGLSLSQLGRHDEAQQILEDVIALHIAGNSPRADLLRAKINLASVYLSQGRIQSSRKQLEEIIQAPGIENVELAGSLHELGVTARTLGEYKRAGELFRHAIQIFRELGGEEHPATLLAKYNLAVTLHFHGNNSQALEMLLEVLEARSRVLGNAHYDTGVTAHRVALLYAELGQVDSARASCLERLALARETYGDDHHRVALWLRRLGDFENGEANLDQSCDYYERAASIYEALPIEEHFNAYLSALNNLSDTLQKLDDFDRSAEIQGELTRLREERREKFPEDINNRIALGGVYCNTGNLERRQGKYNDAVAYYVDAAEVLTEVVHEFPNIQWSRDYLVNALKGRAVCVVALGHSAAAMRALEEAVSVAPTSKQFRNVGITMTQALEEVLGMAPLHRATEVKLMLAACRAKAGNYNAAIQQATACASEATLNGNEQHALAELFAILADPEATQNKALRKKYEQNAIEALEKAREGGFYVSSRRVGFLQGESFDALRDNPDFQAMLGEKGLRETTIDYPDFSDTSNLNLIADAVAPLGPDNVLRLTPALTSYRGGAWHAEPQLVATAFESEFEFQFDNEGSDGIAFVIQNDNALSLGGIGELAITNMKNSLAVAFDTRLDEIAVRSDGISLNTGSTNLGEFTPNFNIDDGQIHHARVSCVPGELSVYLDHAEFPSLTVDVDLSALLDLNAGRAWVGFTSSTEGHLQSQGILNWNFVTFAATGTSIDIADSQVVEGDDTTAMLFTVTRTGDLSKSSTVNWTTQDDSATVTDDDYEAASGQLTFAAGEAEELISVTVNGDSVEETHEQFLIRLSDSIGGFIGDSLAIGSILNDEASLSVADDTVIEGGQGMAYLGEFCAVSVPQLIGSRGLEFGPDGNLYATTLDHDGVISYDGQTGAPLGPFASSDEAGSARGLEFGPDGNIYVSDFIKNQVVRFDGTTGEFIDVFVTNRSGGLHTPQDLAFGPDGDLYVISVKTHEVLRYNGADGSFVETFVTSESGGLYSPQALAFANGYLHVSGGRDYRAAVILRYDALSGAFVDEFVPSGTAGLTIPANGGLTFGPDLNEDGTADLWACSAGSGEVIVFDGATGDHLQTVALSESSDRVRPAALDFGPDNRLYVLNLFPEKQGGNILRYGAAHQAAFIVRLSSPSGVPVTVNYDTADITATSGSDYKATSGTIVFQPGVTSRTIIVPTMDDRLFESDETFEVTLSGAVGATITDGRGVGTILADDDPAKQPPVANDDP